VNRAHILELVARHTANQVQSGPFRGTRLATQACWGDGDLAAKLLGVYEEELHPAINEFAAESYGAIVDIGAADGYYAVGAARLFNETPVFAFDTNEQSHKIIEENAELNGVSNQIICGNLCSGSTLREMAQRWSHLLIIADCEGGESEVFSDAGMIGSLACCDLIIECHDFMRPGITGDLVAKFFNSHFVEIIYSGARNPNRFRFLSHLTDWERWITICENRPAMMNWLVCRSKARSV
jgi:hypothetical protein